ncbi:bZIP transcription factor [Musa troglodytarum]|uniref:BZIP transcription factor n=1 Tax=Musa troglodytarum TaxID=320322 RepID=A0A9E7FI40_9LILI|nr:bZIP transcription factor [Musa troglodytarum]
MWPSEQDNHHGSSNNRAASSSSSSRTSPSSTTSTLLPRTPKRRTMEEVWRDISLCSLHHQERQLTPMTHHQRHSPATSPSFRATMLQDFLAGPLNRPHAVPPAAADDVTRPPSSTTPLTQLSLSPTSLEIQLMGSDAHANSSSSGHNASFISPAFSGNMRRPPSPIGLFSFCSKEAVSENPSASCDRRHKRMIKNRESAARSRARKQASPPRPSIRLLKLLTYDPRDIHLGGRLT